LIPPDALVDEPGEVKPPSYFLLYMLGGIVILKNKLRTTRAWFCTIWVVLLLSSCQSGGEIVEHVEAFVVENIVQNEEGFFLPSGYKKVNSITTHVDNRGAIKSRIQAIEDYYDDEENFVKTIVYDQSHERLKNLQTENTKNLEKELDEPLTIHLPEAYDRKPVQLKEEQKNEVRDHVIKHAKNW